MSAYVIPEVQRAAVVVAHDKPHEILYDIPVTQPRDLAPGQCLIRIDYAGVCQSDLHVLKGDWGLPQMSLPRIGGHEGVGHVVATGKGLVEGPDAIKIGDRVGLKWLARTCGGCDHCRMGNDANCIKPKSNGFTEDGTFAEYIVSYTDYVTPIPDAIDSAAAVSILCAGITVYKALKQSNTIVGNWVCIPGAGGGLGDLAVQYAVAMGLRVVAIDTGNAKKELALKSGAEKWIDFKESKDIIKDVTEATDGLGPHAAVVAAGAAEPFNQAVYYLRKSGTLVLVGMPAASYLHVSILSIVAKGLRLVGSAVGNRQDAVEALDLAARGKVSCNYDVKELDDLAGIFADMEQGKLVGRVVLKI